MIRLLQHQRWVDQDVVWTAGGCTPVGRYVQRIRMIGEVDVAMWND